MHRSTGALARRIEAGHRRAVSPQHHLTVVVGRNATHLIMASRHHGNRFLQRVNASKLQSDFVNAGQPLHDGFRRQMGDVEQHVILVRPAAAAFVDLGDHRARHHIARSQIFGIGCVTLHETLAVGVAQDAALAAHALGNQHPGTGHTGRVKLPELHVLKRNAGTRRHAQPVASVDKCIGRRVIDAPRSAGGEDGGLGVEHHDLAGFHFHRRHAQHIAVGITNQIQRLPFDKELGVNLDVALVHRMQHGVAGTVGRSAGPTHRLFAEVRHVPAKRALIDLAVIEAIKRHAIVFEFDHDFVGLATHELDRILVAEPVGTLDGVVHVPMPVVFLRVAQTGGNATLRCNGMRASRKHLGQHRSFVTGFGKLDRSAQPGTTGADDDRIKFSYRDIHLLQPPQNLYGPAGATDQPQDRQHVQRQTYRHRIDIVHPDVAHTDPGVIADADDEKECCESGRAAGHQGAPTLVGCSPATRQCYSDKYGIRRHDDRRDALSQPVLEPVMGADDDPVHQNTSRNLRATTTVSPRLIASTALAEARACGFSMPT